MNKKVQIVTLTQWSFLGDSMLEKSFKRSIFEIFNVQKKIKLFIKIMNFVNRQV